MALEARVRMAMLLRDDNLFHQQCPRDYLIHQAREHEVDLSVAGSPEALRGMLADSDVLVANEVPKGAIATAPRLIWIHAIAAGVEGLMVPEVLQSGLRLTNSAGTMAPEVAEHALALVLALTRRVDLSIRAQGEKRWAAIRRDTPPIGLSGLTLGIVGYGRIGRAIAERARPFGLRVIGLRRVSSPPDGAADEIVCGNRLPELLARADIIVAALPDTERTRRLFDQTRFRMMKRTAVFVNVGRGAAVDEGALRAALGEGTIAGAASDVFCVEPLPATSPLWDAPNLIVSPHLAGASQHVWPRVIDLTFDNLSRLRRGQTLSNELDTSVGY